MVTAGVVSVLSVRMAWPKTAKRRPFACGLTAFFKS
jgi:hypothetical protein